MSKLKIILRKGAASKISKNNKAEPLDLNVIKDTQTLPPAAIDMELDDLKDYFNEQAWLQLKKLCKSPLLFSISCFSSFLSFLVC